MAANGFDDDQTGSFTNLAASIIVSHYIIISGIDPGGPPTLPPRSWSINSADDTRCDTPSVLLVKTNLTLLNILPEKLLPQLRLDSTKNDIIRLSPARNNPREIGIESRRPYDIIDGD